MGKKTIESHVKKLIDSKSCNPKNSFMKFNEIGSGEYGKVYRACINDKCLNKIAVKNSSNNMSTEYLIAKKLEKMGVPHVYGHDICANRQFLFSEFINGVTLKKFLEKKNVNPVELKSIITQVILLLKMIQEKYPSFRHHDLHLGNIMILKKRTSSKKKIGNVEFDDAKVEVKIMDFGLSTADWVNNPTVKTKSMFKKDYGIFPKSHPAYDMHLFLTSLYTSKRIGPPAKRFIESLFKPEYLIGESKVVKEFRLRSDVEHDLPTYDKVLKHSYFSGPKNSVKTRVNKILSTTPKHKPLEKKKKSPVNQAKAKMMAMNVLKKMANAKKAPKKPPGLKKPSLMKPATKPMIFKPSPK